MHVSGRGAETLGVPDEPGAEACHRQGANVSWSPSPQAAPRHLTRPLPAMEVGNSKL